MMPSFDLLLTVAVCAAYFVLIMALLVHIGQTRGMGDIEAVLCAVGLLVLFYGLWQAQDALYSLAPYLYLWPPLTHLGSRNGVMLIPNGLILLAIIWLTVRVADRCRPVR